jgi:hypothetical protein
VPCPALHRLELEDNSRNGFISVPQRGSGCIAILEPAAGAAGTGDSLGVVTARSGLETKLVRAQMDWWLMDWIWGLMARVWGGREGQQRKGAGDRAHGGGRIWGRRGSERGKESARREGGVRAGREGGGGVRDPLGILGNLVVSPQCGETRFYAHQYQGRRRFLRRKSFLWFSLSLLFNSFDTSTIDELSTKLMHIGTAINSPLGLPLYSR